MPAKVQKNKQKQSCFGKKLYRLTTERVGKCHWDVAKM